MCKSQCRIISFKAMVFEIWVKVVFVSLEMELYKIWYLISFENKKKQFTGKHTSVRFFVGEGGADVSVF